MRWPHEAASQPGPGQLRWGLQGNGSKRAIPKQDFSNTGLCVCLQVMSDPGGGMTFVQDPKKPVGGHVMAHASTQRIYMRKGKGEQRVAKVRTHVIDQCCCAGIWAMRHQTLTLCIQLAARACAPPIQGRAAVGP
jgi:hypothetical protein